MPNRHLAPISQIRQPRDTTAASLLTRLYPVALADGTIGFTADGTGRLPTLADGTLGIDIEATTGKRLTQPATGGDSLIY